MLPCGRPRPAPPRPRPAPRSPSPRAPAAAARCRRGGFKRPPRPRPRGPPPPGPGHGPARGPPAGPRPPQPLVSRAFPAPHRTLTGPQRAAPAGATPGRPGRGAGRGRGFVTAAPRRAARLRPPLPSPRSRLPSGARRLRHAPASRAVPGPPRAAAGACRRAGPGSGAVRRGEARPAAGRRAASPRRSPPPPSRPPAAAPAGPPGGCLRDSPSAESPRGLQRRRAERRAGRGAAPPGPVLPRYAPEGRGAALLPPAGCRAHPRSAFRSLQLTAAGGTAQHRPPSGAWWCRGSFRDPTARCFTSLLDSFQCISTTKQREQDFPSSLTAAFSINRVPTQKARNHTEGGSWHGRRDQERTQRHTLVEKSS